MADRQVKVTLVIDDKGSVKVLQKAGEESAKAEKHLGKLDKQVKGLGKTFGGLKGVIAGGLGAIGVGGIAFGLKDVAEKTKEVATETEKFHTITGIGAKSSLYYTQALKARGLSGEAVNKAFGFLAKNLKSAELQESKFALSQNKAAAKGALTTSVLGRQATAFKELGINLATFNTLSEQGKLEAVTKAFEKLTPGVQKARLERELFGKGGNALSTVLEKNNLGLSHQIELAKKFFPSIKGGANAMNELLEKQSESKMAWEGLEFTLGQKLIPVMTAVEGWFSKTVLEVEKGKGPWGELGHAVSEVVGFFKGAWSAFSNIVGPTNAVKLAVGGLVGVMVISKVAGFVSALAGLGPALAVIQPELIPIAAAIAGIYEGYKHIQEINEFLHPTVKVFAGPHGQEPYTGKGAQRDRGIGRTKLRVAQEEIPHAAQHMNDPFERSALARDINSVAAAQKIDLHLDSQHVAEAIIHNPRAKRIVAESTAIYSQQMTARR